MRIIKVALPLAAVVCFGALSVPLQASPKKSSSSKSKTSEAGSRKKTSTTKKTSKTRSSAKATKGKTKQRAAKGKERSERTVAQTSAGNDWIEELPPVELPEASGPVEDELLEPVAESDLEPDPQ
jgi:hypothetical protein